VDLPKAPRTLSVRLTDDLQVRVAAYVRATGLTKSAAIRVALERALSDDNLSPEKLHSIGVREGIWASSALVKQRIAQTFAELIRDWDSRG
jgi:predicted DNA-binding protein